MSTSFEYKVLRFHLRYGDHSSHHTKIELEETLNAAAQSGWRYRDCVTFDSTPMLILEKVRED